MTDVPASVPPAWHPDPTGRHQFRYWDGARWTEHVADNGAQSIDRLDAAPIKRREEQQAHEPAPADKVRPTFAQRRAAARAERERAREAAQALLRERNAEREQERLAEVARKQAAREAAETRAREQALERERERLAAIAREQEAREAAERELCEAQQRESRALGYPPFYLPEYSGYASVEVAGEFARIDAIHAVLGRKPKLDEELVNEGLLASLVPEPSNPYDRHAVKVVISGQHVGYLEKEVAAVMQPVMLRIVEAGYLPTVGARVWAIARRSYEDGRKLKHHANVRLALTDATRILPQNDPPFEDYSIIPWGGSLQVTGEEHHQEVLGEYVTEEDATLVIGTLTIIQRGTAKAPKELIEVLIDGERIGQLTPGSSQHFIPTVQHLDAQGHTTAVWLRVTGSAIASQVTIHAMRAHELPSDWFAAPHTAPRLHGDARRMVDERSSDDAEIRDAMREPMWGEP